MNEYQTKYLAEVSRCLQRAGFEVKQEENGRLSVGQDSQQICRVDSKGGVFYDPDAAPDMEQVRQQVIDITRMTSEYSQHT